MNTRNVWIVSHSLVTFVPNIQITKIAKKLRAWGGGGKCWFDKWMGELQRRCIKLAFSRAAAIFVLGFFLSCTEYISRNYEVKFVCKYIPFPRNFRSISCFCFAMDICSYPTCSSIIFNSSIFLLHKYILCGILYYVHGLSHKGY